ncbi:hypothetical protein [Stenotrophomonas nematodicola]|jgi:hypothetical protein|uniref:Uncharacterized protein n=1 Tax=Stenotrophomonas nematodicola TaxID=2656746 RepID=A0ABW7CZX1_9GAMM
MASQGNRNLGTASSFDQAWTRMFGAGPVLPKANRWLVLSLAIASMLGAGVAMAAWEVNDSKTQAKLDSKLGSNGTVTGQLNDANTKLSVTKRQSDATPAMVVEPSGEEKLDATKPTATVLPMDKLCTTGADTALGRHQLELCQELAKTELARYRFSLRMFERSKENYDRLKQIQDRRRNLGSNDYANLQYNTNELLTLTALMDNDRDRYQTYMAAYDARVAHIQNMQSALTRNAFKGGGSLDLSGLPGISGLTGGGI